MFRQVQKPGIMFKALTHLNSSVSLLFSSSIAADVDGCCLIAAVVKLLPRGGDLDCST